MGPPLKPGLGYIYFQSILGAIKLVHKLGRGDKAIYCLKTGIKRLAKVAEIKEERTH